MISGPLLRGSQMEREKILSQQRGIHSVLEGKLIKPFIENAQLGQSYLKRSLNWTDENGICMLI